MFKIFIIYTRAAQCALCKCLPHSHIRMAACIVYSFVLRGGLYMNLNGPTVAVFTLDSLYARMCVCA